MAVLAASGISSFALTVPILAVRGIFTACLTQPTTNLPRHRLEARRPAIIPSTRRRAPQSASKDGTHFPLRYRKPHGQARLRFSGGTHVGDSGSIGVSIAGWDGARLGVPGSSLTSSDPEVLAVHSDGTYEALQEGTAEVRITPYLLRNGETRPAGEALNQTVAVTKRPAISGSGGGSSAGAAIGIIAAIVAILGIGSQVLRQMGGRF